MNQIQVTVNERTWDENSRRIEKPCRLCAKPTRGRIDKAPYCMDCGMKRVMQPLASVKEMIRGFFR
jgi:hypothetical protein